MNMRLQTKINMVRDRVLIVTATDERLTFDSVSSKYVIVNNKTEFCDPHSLKLYVRTRYQILLLQRAAAARLHNFSNLIMVAR
jgi:hypothetical protein